MLPSTIGWRKGGPFCAEDPNIRCFTEGYPRSIRSFTPFFPERRSNNAQSSIPTVTPLGEGGRLCAHVPNYPKVRAQGIIPATLTRCMLCHDDIRTRLGVQGVPRDVYPDIYTGVVWPPYLTGHIHQGSLPPTYPGIYTRVAPLPTIPGYTTPSMPSSP